MNLTQTRGIATSMTAHRKQIFTEVARLAYEGGDYSRIEDLPYKIAPGDMPEDRESTGHFIRCKALDDQDTIYN